MSNHKSTESAIKNLEIQVGQLAKQLAENSSSTFGANTEKNPKEEYKAVLTRGRKVILIEDEERTIENNQELVVEEEEEKKETEENHMREKSITENEKEINGEGKEKEKEEKEKNEKEKDLSDY